MTEITKKPAFQKLPMHLKDKQRCADLWDKMAACHAPTRPRRRKPTSPSQVSQTLLINGLKHEVSQMRKLIDMLLVLVDPEDVQAALRIREIAPSHDELSELAAESHPPAELFGME